MTSVILAAIKNSDLIEILIRLIYYHHHNHHKHFNVA